MSARKDLIFPFEVGNMNFLGTSRRCSRNPAHRLSSRRPARQMLPLLNVGPSNTFFAMPGSRAKPVVLSSLTTHADTITSQSFAKAHEASIERLQTALDLDSQQWHPESWGVAKICRGEVKGVVEGFDGRSVSWASGLLVTVAGETPCDIESCPVDVCWQSQLTVWNSPVSDVPHLRTSVDVTHNGIALLIDFIPRSEGGYDAKFEMDESGYPEPDSREAFAQAGVRKDLNERFFTPEVRAWRTSLLEKLGVQTSLPPASNVCGPLYLDVRLPLSNESATAAFTAVADALEQWLGWKRAWGDSELEHVKRTRVYKRDCEMRAFYSRMAEAELIKRHGFILGQNFAGADAGPEAMKSHSKVGQRGAGDAGGDDSTKLPFTF